MHDGVGVVGAILLLVGAAFSLLVWPVFLRRVAKDDRARHADGTPTRFLTVHVVLIGAALVIALAQGVAGIWWLIDGVV